MIISAVKGGLGNMMFQIAAGASLAKEMKVDYSYTYDCWGSSTSYDISKYPTTIFKNIPKISLREIRLENYKKYSEPSFEYQEIPRYDNLVLDGYFQSIKYFKNNTEHIRQLFSVETIDKYLNHTFLHVRRKDYLKYENIHPVCSKDYYMSSLEFINPSNCIVVSDDMNWCKQNFVDSIFEFSDSKDDLQDLIIMKSCKNAIISNSTFSWWGAVLNKNSNMVIAPQQWFGQQGPKNWQDVYCDNWKII